MSENIAYRGNDLLSRYGRMALHKAAGEDDIEVVKWFFKQDLDFDVNARDYVFATPMHEAAIVNAVEVMKWLKDKGGDINARDSRYRTPFHRAAYGNSLAAMKWLKAEGADINAKDRDGKCPMDFTMFYHGTVGNMLEWMKLNGGTMTGDNSDQVPEPTPVPE